MNAKKFMVLVAGGVLVYCLVVYPIQLANGVQTTFGWLTTGVESAITFVRNVFT